MSGSNGGPASRETVSIALMKGEDASTIVESVLESQDGIRLIDKGTYWQLETEGFLEIDVDDVADRLGRPFTVGEVQVSLTTYVGRIDVGFDRILVTSAMLQMGGTVTPT